MLNRKKITIILILFAMIGCNQPKRQFDGWKWSWPKWWKKSEQSKTANQTAQKTAANVSVGNNFEVRILESTGDESCLQNIWSYLDESSPLSENWQLLHRNGMRAGLGQYSDWPMVKQQLEKCGTRVKSQVQVVLGSFRAVKLLSDKYRSERTLFYYDINGKVHGRDFGPSRFELVLSTAGRMPAGRIRVILSPKITKYKPTLKQLAKSKVARKSTGIEKELENFSITVDMGPKEFVLIGPSSKELSKHLIGSQLFVNWLRGQKHSFFVLLSPAQLESVKKGK